MKRSVISLSIVAALLFLMQPCAGQPFTQVIVFGDSNVDSGYYKQLSSPGGGATYNADWPTGVAHGAGAPTSSPGLMSSQVLAAFFGLTANPANTAGGTNYATSGAKNVTVNSAATGGFTAAVPTVTQINNYLTGSGGVANSQALFLIYSGDNDVSYANQDTGQGPWPADPNAYLTQAANDLANAVVSLRNAGAQTIIVSGLAYSFPTNDANKRALKALYTNALWNSLTTAGVSFFRGDVDTVRVAIAANPAKYGFTTVSNSAANAACTAPSGVTSAWALLCSSNAAAPSTWVSATAPQTHLFADDQHLATAGQKLIGNYFHGLVVPPNATHDFNGDRKSDVAWRQTGGTAALWLMNGAAIAQSGVLGTIPAAWQIVGQRDFNGDGKRDLLWRDGSSGTVAIWLMNGLQVAQSGTLGAVGTNWAIAGTGDFNGDGRGDILWRDSTTGAVAVWLLNGLQVLQTGSLGTVASNWVIAGTGDFNGDGNTDILWRDTTSGTVAIWLMNGLQIAQIGNLGAVDSSWSIAGTGDFDGDGNGDLLWRSSTGTVAVWLLNGLQVAQSGTLGTVNKTWVIPATGDFNGDGKTDLLWRETTNGTTAIWFLNGLQIVSSANLGSVGTDWTVQGVNAE
ncbi:MAG: FG-GAP-like repeat-containing protein [Xanthobacteraceae bacterium]